MPESGGLSTGRTRPRRSAALLAGKAVVGFVLVCAVLVAAAVAQDYPPDEGGVEVSRTEVAPGGTLAVAASGFCPGGAVDIVLQPPPSARVARRGRRLRRVRLARASANGRGEVSRRLRVPSDIAPGAYDLVARGPDADCLGTREVSSRLIIAADEDTGSSQEPAGGTEGSSRALPVDAEGGGGGRPAGSGDGGGPAGSGDGGLARTGRDLGIVAALGLLLACAGSLLRRRARRADA